MALRRRSTFRVQNDHEPVLKSTTIDSSDTRVSKTSCKKENVMTTAQLVCVVVFSLIPWIPSLWMNLKVNKVRKLASISTERNDVILGNITSALDKRQSLKHHVKMLEEHNKNLLATLKDQGDMIDPGNNLYKIAEETEEAYLNRISDMEEEIKSWSFRQMEAKFSNPDKKSKFEFQVINIESDKTQRFLIETFPLDEIPHATAVMHEIVASEVFADATLEYETSPSCLNIMPNEAHLTSFPALLQSIRFQETPSAFPSATGVNVWIGGRKDFRPLISFCSGSSTSSEESALVRSFVGTVVHGSSFFEEMQKPTANEQNLLWRINSIRTVGDK